MGTTHNGAYVKWRKWWHEGMPNAVSSPFAKSNFLSLGLSLDETDIAEFTAMIGDTVDEYYLVPDEVPDYLPEVTIYRAADAFEHAVDWIQR